MTLQQQAEAADSEGRTMEAVRLYEAALSAEPSRTDLLVDLVVLYWQATDYGIWTSKGLDPAFVARASKRFRELLDQGRTTAPDDPAVRFWNRYIAWAELGESFDREECRALLRAHPKYLEPAMFLLAVSQGRECESEARELMRLCKGVRTSRCRYVVSVIEGLLNRISRSKE